MKNLHILVDSTVSIAELKKSPIAAIQSGGGLPVAVLDDDCKPLFYCIDQKAYELLLDRLEDFELNQIADKREDGDFVVVDVDDL